MLGGVTITRVWMARPFQTRSRHWDIDGSQCTEVAKEGCNAPGWITEQGKTLALGSGRISCQNPEVAPLSYKLQLEHQTITTSFYHTHYHPIHPTHPIHPHFQNTSFYTHIHASTHPHSLNNIVHAPRPTTSPINTFTLNHTPTNFMQRSPWLDVPRRSSTFA